MWQAVQEVRCAVEGVNDPAVNAVGAFFLRAFFGQPAISGPRFHQRFFQNFFGFDVGARYEIAGALHGNLKVLHLAKVAHQRAGSAAGGFDHHIKVG